MDESGWWRAGLTAPALLGPRFGCPVVARAGSGFFVETFERGGAPRPTMTLRRAGEERDIPLAVDEELVIAGEGGALRVRRRVRAPDALGGYDLYLRFADGSEAQAPRVVWLRGDPPDAIRPVEVAHITDLHVGSGERARSRLERVLADVNRLLPDLVLVTGDVANNGDRAGLMPEARRVLATLEAPALVVPGNHDHGFSPRALAGLGPGRGIRHFADAFHAFRHFSLTLGGWDFVGFDSGPTRLSPLVRTRGIDADAVAAIARDLEGAHARGRHGVVLFSHTPSRTRLTGTRATSIAGPLARMGRGARALEQLLREAAGRGQRVLHLTGHTHWTEVFEIDEHGRRFLRWDHRRLGPGAHSVESPIALVNSQSASHSGFGLKRSARGHGFTRVLLDGSAASLEFHRYD